VPKKSEIKMVVENSDRYNKTSFSEEKIIGIRSFSNNGITSIGTSSFAPTILSGISNGSAAESQITRMMRVSTRANNITTQRQSLSI
jgi:hypothetical protein